MALGGVEDARPRVRRSGVKQARSASAGDELADRHLHGRERLPGLAVTISTSPRFSAPPMLTVPMAAIFSSLSTFAQPRRRPVEPRPRGARGGERRARRSCRRRARFDRDHDGTAAVLLPVHEVRDAEGRRVDADESVLHAMVCVEQRTPSRAGSIFRRGRRTPYRRRGGAVLSSCSPVAGRTDW